MDSILDYLTPDTLASACADIAEQAHEIGMNDKVKAQAIAFLEMGRNLVGKDEFDQMVEEMMR